MMKIVLAESELELVPESIRHHKCVKRPKEGGVVLLDSNFHHSAMKGLPEAYRRGRPDIVHVCLLNALDSPLNRAGSLEFYVHTRNDDVIEMSPKWRVPRSYNRFVGLMENLFEQRTIEHDKDMLLNMKKMGLAELIGSISDGMEVKLMHYQGRRYAPSEDSVIIIGGFPHGDFKEDLGFEKYSICSEELMAWSVVNHVIYTL